MHLLQVESPITAAVAAQEAHLKASEELFRSHVDMLRRELDTGNLGVHQSEASGSNTAPRKAEGDDDGEEEDSDDDDDAPSAVEPAGDEAEDESQKLRRELSVIVASASEMLLPSEVTLDSNVQSYVSVRAYNAAGQYVGVGVSACAFVFATTSGAARHLLGCFALC